MIAPRTLALAAAVLVAAVASAAADKPQTACPVDGKALDRAVHVDWQGQRVYFCSAACLKAFRADPEKTFATIEKAGVVLESVQTEDPVCDMPQKPEGVHADYKGRRVYFCSDYCKGEFGKDPAHYLAKLPGEHPAAR